MLPTNFLIPWPDFQISGEVTRPNTPRSIGSITTKANFPLTNGTSPAEERREILSMTGVFLGGGPVLYDYGFRAVPYVSRLELRGGYSSGARKFRFDFRGDFYTVVPGARVQVFVLASQLERLNFFGFGNETLLDANLSRDR